MSEKRKKEEQLYGVIISVLKEKFSQLGECYLENTSRNFSDKMKEHLEDDSLFILNVEKMSPDITGYFRNESYSKDEIIIVEVKLKPTLKDIYQTKRYAEILKASYAFLISPRKLSAERRRFLLRRKEQITQFDNNGRKQIYIGQFYQEALKNFIRIDKEFYYNLPEPFKEESK